MLQNVIKAVTVPLKSLFLTTVVGLIVMYEYAILGFYFFRQDYDGSCNSMLDCTTTTIYQGLRMDIGTALLPTTTHDDTNWYKRIAFDLSYFVVITTVLMNVIFGIIIDTFGSLRDKTNEREHHMQNNTFISCIDRMQAEKAGQALGIVSGFEFIEKVKQNTWSYLNFIFYLKRKDPTEYTGPETRARVCLDDDDVTWMPLNVCKLMEERVEEWDSDLSRLEAEMRKEIRMIKQDLGPMKDDLASIRQIVTLQRGGSDANLEDQIRKRTYSTKRLEAMGARGS
jgi:inositol 1,4,5-triphosphate receptor type 1/inositol 1,4,5-triphosphate receptor type 3